MKFQYFVNILVVICFPCVWSKLPNFCRLPNGDSGMCIETKKCPDARYENVSLPHCTGNNKNLICCPAIARIVTPSDPSPPNYPIPPPIIPIVTLPPVIVTEPPPPSPTPTSSLPIIDVTTKMNIIDDRIANAKCEEYQQSRVKRASIITYVFGGTETPSQEYPHMAALGYGNNDTVEWLCGGSLISEQYVLTAAHCLVISQVGPLVLVRLGDLNLKTDTDDAKPLDFGVLERIVHPLYQRPTQYHDIALVKLDRIVPFSSYIAPICLETLTMLPNNDFIATGWGKTENSGDLSSDTLMQVDLEYFSNDVCQRTYAYISPESLPYGILDYCQICAGSHAEQKDTCQGDSGGPLQIRDQNRLYLVGVTSFGLECGIPNQPAVYTRVSYYVPWIEHIVWPQS